MMRTLLFAALLIGASAQPNLGRRNPKTGEDLGGGLYDLYRLANDPEVADHAEVKADAKKLVSLALEADVAFEEGQMELKKTLAANMKAEQAKMRAQRLASTVAEMKSQGV